MVRARGRLRAPGTSRQHEGGFPSTGSTLHRWAALDTEARSRRARSASPRRLRASRRRPPRRTLETRPSRSRREVSLETPEGERPITPPRSPAVIQGQSDSRSSTRLSAGLSTAGSRWSGIFFGSSGMERSRGSDSRVRGCSTGNRPRPVLGKKGLPRAIGRRAWRSNATPGRRGWRWLRAAPRPGRPDPDSGPATGGPGANAPRRTSPPEERGVAVGGGHQPADPV